MRVRVLLSLFEGGRVKCEEYIQVYLSNNYAFKLESELMQISIK